MPNLQNIEHAEMVARTAGKGDVDEALEQSSGKYQSKLPTGLFEQVTDTLAEILVLDYQNHHPVHSKKNGSIDTEN